MLRISKSKLIATWIVCFFSILLSMPTLFQGGQFHKIVSGIYDRKVNLGLDLRGGAHILLNVDVDSYRNERIESYLSQIKKQLRNDKIKFSKAMVARNNNIIFSGLIKQGQKTNSSDQIASIKRSVFNAIGDSASVSVMDGGVAITLYKHVIEDITKDLMSQSLEIVRRRIDESGVKEIDIQVQGDDNILLQVPGMDNPDDIKRLIGKTAKLTFHMVEEGVKLSEAASLANAGISFLPLSGTEHIIAINANPLITGDMLDSAHVSMDNYGSPVVSFRFNNLGAKIFAEVTSKNTGKLFAIVLDDEVISAPRINEPILGGAGQISGNFTMQSATELSLLLRAGALPAPIKVVEERTVGPSLGVDSINAGKKSYYYGCCICSYYNGFILSCFRSYS